MASTTFLFFFRLAVANNTYCRRYYRDTLVGNSANREYEYIVNKHHCRGYKHTLSEKLWLAKGEVYGVCRKCNNYKQ